MVKLWADGTRSRREEDSIVRRALPAAGALESSPTLRSVQCNVYAMDACTFLRYEKTRFVRLQTRCVDWSVVAPRSAGRGRQSTHHNQTIIISGIATDWCSLVSYVLVHASHPQTPHPFYKKLGGRPAITHTSGKGHGIRISAPPVHRRRAPRRQGVYLYASPVRAPAALTCLPATAAPGSRSTRTCRPTPWCRP